MVGARFLRRADLDDLICNTVCGVWRPRITQRRSIIFVANCADCASPAWLAGRRPPAAHPAGRARGQACACDLVVERRFGKEAERPFYVSHSGPNFSGHRLSSAERVVKTAGNSAVEQSTPSSSSATGLAIEHATLGRQVRQPLRQNNRPRSRSTKTVELELEQPLDVVERSCSWGRIDQQHAGACKLGRTMSKPGFKAPIECGWPRPAILLRPLCPRAKASFCSPAKSGARLLGSLTGQRLAAPARRYCLLFWFISLRTCNPVPMITRRQGVMA